MLKKFLKTDRGTAAIEFAIVVLPFLLIIFATLEIGAKTLMQSELDHSMHNIAKKFSRQSDAGMSIEKFKEDEICPNLSALLDCDKLLFGIDSFSPGQDMFAAYRWVYIDRWNTGCGGYTSVLEMYYPLTDIMFNFAIADVVTYEEEEYYRARAMLRREPGVVGNGQLWHKSEGLNSECTGDLGDA